MRNSNVQTVSTSPLQPTMVIDVTTGELLTLAEWTKPVARLAGYTQTATAKLWRKNKKRLLVELQDFTGSASSYGRKLGYKIDYTKLPKKVLAKSRIQELVLHRLVSEGASYVLNPDEDKKEPTFPKTLTLGSVNQQMVTRSYDPEDHTISIEWKVWDKHLFFEFHLPAYLLERDIAKYSNPTIKIDDDGKVWFYFSIQENLKYNPDNGLRAGLDAGVAELYTVAVTNKNGNRVAHYSTSKRLKHLQTRKQATLSQKHQLERKIENLTLLNPSHPRLPTLEVEKNRVKEKVTRLGKEIAKQVGAEVAKRLNKHSLNLLKVEDLSWVTGTKTSKTGSNHSFQHSRQVEALTPIIARVGIRVKKINPWNTSQTCHKCGARVAHDTAKRLAHCAPCRAVFDRDFNAAMNIANKPLPTRHERAGRETKALRATSRSCKQLQPKSFKTDLFTTTLT